MGGGEGVGGGAVNWKGWCVGVDRVGWGWSGGWGGGRGFPSGSQTGAMDGPFEVRGQGGNAAKIQTFHWPLNKLPPTPENHFQH